MGIYSWLEDLSFLLRTLVSKKWVETLQFHNGISDIKFVIQTVHLERSSRCAQAKVNHFKNQKLKKNLCILSFDGILIFPLAKMKFPI